jgi:hypothetical protein
MGGVNLHSTHLKDHGVACFVCHDPHGTAIEAGATPAGNARLINFATDVTGMDASYDADLQGCTVSCHGADPWRSY